MAPGGCRHPTGVGDAGRYDAVIAPDMSEPSSRPTVPDDTVAQQAQAGSSALPLFAGGDVAAVMAGFDWSASTLGPPAQWPGLLQTMVRILLTSRFSMWMGWGPDLRFLYNDAYARDTLGAKHPWALGRPAREVWSEAWDDLGPRIDAVLRTGQATWDEALLLFLERSGYREETYHTFSYSPISDVDGGIVGMLCVVTEDTERVINDRRLATLGGLAAELSSAQTERAVFDAVTERLAANRQDLPFALTYVFEGDGGARLAAASGIDVGHPAAPPRIDVKGGDAAWPLDEVLRTGRSVLLDGVATRFGALPSGAWEDPPDRALLVPLAEGGQTDPVGVFVAACNPYRPPDPAYRNFAELLAGQVASAMASARAYEAERQRAEALAELDRAKTEFFSNVSHEFRTPLTLILGPVEDALADDLEPLPDPQRLRLRVVQRNARRLRRLVNDMLDFARIEGGRLEAETVPTDLAALTREVALSFAPAVERAGLAFHLDVEPSVRPVAVDQGMWEKIVLNLLSNALKFTLAGSVTCRLRPEGDTMVLAVSDTGVGVPADQLPLLFQRFHRAPRTAARSHEGTGIGLALVAELARLHGGSVAATSEPGVGSTFTVTIPMGTATGTAIAGQRESSRQAFLDEALQWVADEVDEADTADRRTLAGRTAEATVLVADDNPDVRGYLRRLLEPFWRVVVAADGAEALELARRDPPDLVLTDVMMPRLDGFGLLTGLRRDPATATVPVVFLSARAGEEAAVEGLDAGADDYLVKPFSGIELVARVRSNLELAALRNREAQWRAALVESLQDGVAVTDAAGRMVEANAAFERILGYSHTDRYDPPYPWFPDPEREPAHFAQTNGAFEQLLAGERLNAVLPVRHRLGHQLFVALSASAVGEGDDRRFVVALHDVTAELAAAEREAALAQLATGLAEATDVAGVRRAGLAELRRVFGATDAVVVSWADDRPQARGADGSAVPLDGRATEALARARDERRVVAAAADGSRTSVEDEAGPVSEEAGPVSGVAAPLDPADVHRALWLDIDPPRPMSADDRSLVRLVANLFGQALRRAQLFDDLREVATALQRSILGPTDVPDGMAVRYLPAVRALEVGGDWYDVVGLAEGCLAVVVGDCTGRGLQAATTMGQLRSACRALLLQAKGPADVIDALDSFAERIPGASCTTVFCAVIDTDEGTMRYSCAGHLPAVVLEPSGATTLLDQASALPLGIAPGRSRPEASATLAQGATVLLYTDGLVERRHEAIDAGIARLRLALGDMAGHHPTAIADGVLDALLPAEGQEDDVAVVAYRQGTPDLHLTAPASPEHLGVLRQQLRHWLAAVGVAQRPADELVVAVGEACANAMEHAYGFDPAAEVAVDATYRAGRIEVRVTDRGGWKEARSTSDERGRGLAIMRALVDEVDVQRDPGGTVVQLRRRLAAPDAAREG